jgi:uncharacterized protein with ParB-like and HNH nuclease domain
MNAGKYTLKEFLTNPTVDQVIIPEIQRDYVWTKNNVLKLLTSIQEDSRRQSKLAEGTTDEALSKLSPEIREALQRTLKAERRYTNIGFIYAYFDPELIDRYFLIDGQQRVTTLYLLLLSLSIKASRQDYFRRTYFDNQIPKVDYKVREAAHDFLVNVIGYLLNSGDIANVKDQYWYHSEYENDKTIQSLIHNYSTINDFVKSSDIDFDFAQNNIELWYYDTQKSEQGEELYIYMNSRGEAVQVNENIKAQLLEGLSEQEKHNWGLTWEGWQNFFWKNRDDNKNADDGFNEFLKWINIIERIASSRNESLEVLADFIREIQDKTELTIEYLGLNTINQYFDALERIASDKRIEYFNSGWLHDGLNSREYIQWLPMLMYTARHQEEDYTAINRYSRYFFNIVRKDEVSKSSPDYAVHAIRLTHEFLSKNLKDVVDLATLTGFDTIVTKEESFKLGLYKNPVSSFTREDYEKSFWMVEDFDLSLGSLQIVLGAARLTIDDPERFDLILFNNYATKFTSLFRSRNDLLRRALFTFGNYWIHVGFSTKLGMSKYSFGYNTDEWRRIVRSESGSRFVKDFLDYFVLNEAVLANLGVQEQLEHRIQDFVENGHTIPMWSYELITKPVVLEYSQNKRACAGDDGPIYLLQGSKAHNYKTLEQILSM